MQSLKINRHQNQMKSKRVQLVCRSFFMKNHLLSTNLPCNTQQYLIRGVRKTDCCYVQSSCMLYVHHLFPSVVSCDDYYLILVGRYFCGSMSDNYLGNPHIMCIKSSPIQYLPIHTNHNRMWSLNSLMDAYYEKSTQFFEH